MRQPTTAAALYAWHRAALNGERPPVREGEPQCGWYRRRMVRGGPWVPARIWCEREIDPMTGELASDEVLRCEVAGERRDPAGAWLSVANNPITRARFAELVSTHARDATMAATHIRRDLTQEPTRP